VESQLSTPKAKLYASNDLPSDSTLLGFQQQPAQSTSSAYGQSPLVEHLQAFIGSELQACREALTSAQETFMTKLMATLDARLEANSAWQNNNAATSLGDLQNDVRKLEGNQKEMELHWNKFETQVISLLDVYEECIRGLQQGASSSALQL
jgi:hypothetical protein